MPRRFRMLATGVALVLAALAPPPGRCLRHLRLGVGRRRRQRPGGRDGTLTPTATFRLGGRDFKTLAFGEGRDSSANTSSRSSGLWSWSI
jgi:hypothetical protein